MADQVPEGYIKVVHSGVQAITYIDVSKITHVVDLKNAVRIHVGASGDYIASTESVDDILDKISAARGGSKAKKAA